MSGGLALIQRFLKNTFWNCHIICSSKICSTPLIHFFILFIKILWWLHNWNASFEKVSYAGLGGCQKSMVGGNLSPPVLPTLSLGRLVKWNNYQNGQGDYLMGVSQGTVFFFFFETYCKWISINKFQKMYFKYEKFPKKKKKKMQNSLLFSKPTLPTRKVGKK